MAKKINAPKLPENAYLTILKPCVIRRAEIVLARIKQAGLILPAPLLKQALLLLDYSLVMAEAWPGTRELLFILAPKMEEAGYRDEWMPYLEQGIWQGRQLGDLEEVAELQFQLGLLYQLRSKYIEARNYLEASARGFERLNIHSGRARALNRLAYVARLQRQFKTAVRLVETVQQLVAEENEEWAFSYYVMSLIALDKRLWQDAVDFSERAFSLWERTNQRRLMGRSLLCRGVALEKMRRYSEALAICQQANLFFEELSDNFYQAIAQMNLGNVYFALEELSKALELYLHAERNFRQVQDLLYLAHVNHNIGMSYRQLQELDKAKETLLLGIKLWQQLGNIERWTNSMDELGLVYLEEGQVEKAQVIFTEALTQLTRIKDEPGYMHWLEILTNHLGEVMEKKVW